MPAPKARPSRRMPYSANVRLTPAQHAGLVLVGEQLGEGISATIRIAVDAYLRGFADKRSGDDLLQVLEDDTASEQRAVDAIAQGLGR